MAEDYSLQTSIVIDAPAKKIYEVMADLNQFDMWNPFKVMDPQSHSTVTQKAPGVGATYEYQGKRIGRGRMVITSVTSPSLIESEMTFFNRRTETAHVQYRLSQESAGTLVTWHMQGTRGRGQRIMVRLLNLDKMMGRTFAQGLERLKAYVEASR